MGLYDLVAGECDGKDLVIKGGPSCPQMGFRMFLVSSLVLEVLPRQS